MKNLKTFEEHDIKKELDPFGEENWNDENIKGYFIAHSNGRFFMDNYFVKNFLMKYKPKIHSTLEEGIIELRKGFYDDEDYGVYVLYDDGEVEKKY